MSLVMVTLATGTQDVFLPGVVQAVEVCDNGLAVVMTTGEHCGYLWEMVAKWTAPARLVRERRSRKAVPYTSVDDAVWWMANT